MTENEKFEEDAGKLTAEEQVRIILPNIKIRYDHTHLYDVVRYVVHDDERVYGFSFTGEDVAWSWTLAIINRKIMDKLEQ